MKTLWIVAISCLGFLPLGIFAQESKDYGAFIALQIDSEIVKDVLVEGDDLYVKIASEFHDNEVAVRLSDAKLRGYRNWEEGGIERFTKIYRSNSQNKQGYTYRINTSAKFIEYWLDEKFILHLERK